MTIQTKIKIENAEPLVESTGGAAIDVEADFPGLGTVDSSGFELLPHQGPELREPGACGPETISSASEAGEAGPDTDLAKALRAGRLGSIKWDKFLGVEVLEKLGSRILLDEVETTRLFTSCQQLGLKVGSRAHFEQVVHMIAKDDSFDSAQEWLDQLPAWDGTQRVVRFLPNYLGAAGGPYEQAVGRYLWTALVSRILFPGCQADMVPVMVGPQGVRKSTLLRTIVPTPELCVEACLTDQSSKLARKILGKMLLAWEEMRGIRGKCDADEVKTFITLPYVETSGGTKTRMVRHDRRFIIIGTSNTKDVLRDPTGHRRFLPFDVPQVIAIDKVEADRLQLWAEGLHLVQDRVARGQAPVDYEDAERLAEQVHAAYLREARWVGEKSLLDWLQRKPGPFTAEEALHAIGFRPEQITSREKREMAETLRQLGIKKGSARPPGSNNPVQRWKTF